MEIANLIILIGSLVTAIGIIIGTMKKLFSRAMTPVNEKIDKLDSGVTEKIDKLDKCISHKIDKLDERECKRCIVDYLNDVENGVQKDSIQSQLIHEVYDHYTNDLHCNSYVHDKWERVMNGVGKK